MMIGVVAKHCSGYQLRRRKILKELNIIIIIKLLLRMIVMNQSVLSLEGRDMNNNKKHQ